MPMSDPKWPAKPFDVETIGGLPAIPKKTQNDVTVAGQGRVSALLDGVHVDKSDKESLGEAVFTLMVRGETDARVIARTLGIPIIQVRALVAQAKKKFGEAAVEIASNPEARRMALSSRAEEIYRMALSDAMSLGPDSAQRQKALALALRCVVEQVKLEGLETQKVEVTEHKINERRDTVTVTRRLEDEFARFGVDEEGVLRISRAAVGVISQEIETKLKGHEEKEEDVVDAEVVES